LIAVALCATLTFPALTAAQGRGGGNGHGRGGRGGGHGGGHGFGHSHGGGNGHFKAGGFVPPGVPIRGSVQGTINRFLSGGNLGYGGYHDHYHVHPASGEPSRIDVATKPASEPKSESSPAPVSVLVPASRRVPTPEGALAPQRESLPAPASTPATPDLPLVGPSN
jgi:hypothetical protein